eukprot:g18271.t1
MNEKRTVAWQEILQAFEDAAGDPLAECIDDGDTRLEPWVQEILADCITTSDRFSYFSATTRSGTAPLGVGSLLDEVFDVVEQEGEEGEDEEENAGEHEVGAPKLPRTGCNAGKGVLWSHEEKEAAWQAFADEWEKKQIWGRAASWDEVEAAIWPPAERGRSRVNVENTVERLEQRLKAVMCGASAECDGSSLAATPCHCLSTLRSLQALNRRALTSLKLLQERKVAVALLSGAASAWPQPQVVVVEAPTLRRILARLAALLGDREQCIGILYEGLIEEVGSLAPIRFVHPGSHDHDEVSETRPQDHHQPAIARRTPASEEYLRMLIPTLLTRHQHQEDGDHVVDHSRGPWHERDREAAGDILEFFGYEARFALFDYVGVPRGFPLLERSENPNSIFVFDDVLPDAALNDLERVFDAAFFAQHDYNPLLYDVQLVKRNPAYFSLFHDLKKPKTFLDRTLETFLARVTEALATSGKEAEVSFAADLRRRAFFAETWTHKRTHLGYHQLHVDSKDEGCLHPETGLPENPVATFVIYLDGEAEHRAYARSSRICEDPSGEVESSCIEDYPLSPTLITDQVLKSEAETVHSARGKFVFPRRNRAACFSGDLYHGVLPGKISNDEGLAGARYRHTLMISLWEHLKPNAMEAPTSGVAEEACAGGGGTSVAGSTATRSAGLFRRDLSRFAGKDTPLEAPSRNESRAIHLAEKPCRLLGAHEVQDAGWVWEGVRGEKLAPKAYEFSRVFQF